MNNGKPGNFDIMREMAKPGGQIWMAPLDNVLAMDKNKHGTKVSIGVGFDCIQKFMRGEYIGGLYLCDRDEYIATKARLEAEWEAPQQVGGTADAAGEKQKP